MPTAIKKGNFPSRPEVSPWPGPTLPIRKCDKRQRENEPPESPGPERLISPLFLPSSFPRRVFFGSRGALDRPFFLLRLQRFFLYRACRLLFAVPFFPWRNPFLGGWIKGIGFHVPWSARWPAGFSWSHARKDADNRPPRWFSRRRGQFHLPYPSCFVRTGLLIKSFSRTGTRQLTAWPTRRRLY